MTIRTAPEAAPSAAAVPTAGDAAPDSLLVQAIDACLPQTQCGKCGHGGCLPYARAIAARAAPINRCPPGGDAGVALLAGLLGQPRIELDPSCGAPRALHVALIDESRCIGCTLCLQACPVDAIAGAPKAMHTVVAAECTGCELCLPPCPVDCIEMRAVAPEREWTRADADAARRRLHERERRLARERERNDARLEAKALRKLIELDAGRATRDAPTGMEAARRRALVEAALERVRARRSSFAAGALRGPAASEDESSPGESPS